MAYGIIVWAARISDTLKAGIEALSGRYKSENEWLRGVQVHLLEIIDDPENCVDCRDLREEESVTPQVSHFSTAAHNKDLMCQAYFLITSFISNNISLSGRLAQNAEKSSSAA